MKQFSIILAIAFLDFCALKAQNWAPIHLGDLYYFLADEGTSSHLTQLRVDSAGVVNGDSVFHLNRVFVKCPDCTVFLCDTLVQEGQFLQRTMTKQADGSYLMSGLHQLLLKPHAPLGESWMFDAANGIQATVDAVGEQTVLGQLDSIKHLQLSNGMAIKLSKRFGILESPDFSDLGKSYELVGIPNKGLGVDLPDYKRIYDYHAGDILQYKFSFYSSDEPNPGSDDYYKKLRVLDRMDFNDSIVYLMESRRYVGEDNMPLPSGFPIDTLTWKIDASAVKHTPALEHLITSVIYQGEPFEDGLNMTDIYTSPLFQLDSNNRVSMQYNFTNPAIKYGALILDSTNLYHYDTIEHCTFNNQDLDISGDLIFEEGKGVTHFGFLILSFQANYGKWTELVGSVIDSDTLGVVFPDSIANTGVTPPPYSVEFALEPFSNLIHTDPVHIAFQKPLGFPLELAVFNTAGQKILEQTIPYDGRFTDLYPADWPRGYYFLRLRGDKLNHVEKLLKW